MSNYPTPKQYADWYAQQHPQEPTKQQHRKPKQKKAKKAYPVGAQVVFWVGLLFTVFVILGS